MQPTARSIFDLFDGKKRYLVPLFQRQYVWSRDAQWEPLWEDLERKFVEKIQHKDGPPHFLGAMVLDQKRFYGNQVPTHLVIDGQQRLTTFQIFLAAFRDVCHEQEQNEFADECQRYLLNTGIMTDQSTECYKVWPTNLDRSTFKDIINSGSRTEIENRHQLKWRKYARRPEPRPAIIECYLFFYDQILSFLQSDNFTQPISEKINRLFEALRSCLQVVTIELEGNEDPQLIFETLNARGEPLLPSDLLRNFIFWRAAQNNESQDELYTQYWLPFDDSFWREQQKQGRFYRPRSDIFLQHYLALKRKEDINVGHLFAEYKYWVKTEHPFSTVCDELKEMQRHRNFFRKLIEPNTSTTVWRLANALQFFDITTIYPLILGLLERSLPPEIEIGIFTDLESYIVRRAICNFTTKNYNRLFLSILSKLPGVELTRDSFRRILLEFQGDISLWPRDDVFAQAWLNNPSYDNLPANRIIYILQAIERHLHETKNEEVEIKSDLTIEHILPQNWIENWPLLNGNTGATFEERWDKTRNEPDIKASEERDKLIHSFGNLTLLTQPLNSSISNGPFTVKKPEILKHSALVLNRYFQDINEWNEEQIKQRGKVLFEHARKIWLYPE